MKILKIMIIGICSGFVTGLFSTGGGMIVLPSLIYFLNFNEKNARATTIFSILPMVITSAFFYYSGKNINFFIAIECVIGGIIGSIIGTKLLGKVSNKILKIIFILFLLYASYNMVLK